MVPRDNKGEGGQHAGVGGDCKPCWKDTVLESTMVSPKVMHTDQGVACCLIRSPLKVHMVDEPNGGG